MASRVKKSTSTVRLTSSTPLISAAIPVRLKKAHLKILIPAVELLASSYRKHVKNGSSPFTYPFRIYPQPSNFDRGRLDENIMGRFVTLTGALKANGASKTQIHMDTFEIRGAVFAIRTYIDSIRSLMRQQRTFYRLKPKQRTKRAFLAQLRVESRRVIQVLERNMKRANRALLKAIGTNQYDAVINDWKAHLRWMRLHLAFYKPLGKPPQGQRIRQQRDLDELMEMARHGVHDEGYRLPTGKQLRHLMRLYARYARGGRRGYLSVRDLLENKSAYSTRWHLAQFVIDRSNLKELKS